MFKIRKGGSVEVDHKSRRKYSRSTQNLQCAFNWHRYTEQSKEKSKRVTKSRSPWKTKLTRKQEGIATK